MPAMGILMACVFTGCQNAELKERLLGRWEKTSGQMRRGGPLRPFKPGEVIIEYREDGRLIATWDNQPHYYDWWIMDHETVKKRDESGLERMFTYTFDEDEALSIVEVGSGMRSRYRRLE